MSESLERLESVKNRIRRGARLVGRDERDIQLVAVSKTQPEDRIDAILSAGQRIFGENRVQEAEQRWLHRKAHDPSIRLHLIGPLQTNKAAAAVSLFDCIETLDREKLAAVLSNEMRKQEKTIPCLIQVNTGDEPQKAGIAPQALNAFIDYCRHDCGLDIRGLMCIPPEEEPAGLHFAFLAGLARRHRLVQLSMGMSGDFEKAIAAGATHIRVGSALFGSRG